MIIAWYADVESGTKSDRPELAKAVSHAASSKAKLVIAKLDRLARDVHFTSKLMKGGADFVCCDNPHANKFTLHILAAVAEHEADLISQRTKAALQAAKARGVKLGSHRKGHWSDPKRSAARLEGIHKASQIAASLRSEEAANAYAHVIPEITDLRGKGKSLHQIAQRLTELHLPTPRGGTTWHASQVSRAVAYA